MNIRVSKIDKGYVTVAWDAAEGAERYDVYWSDTCTPDMVYKNMGSVGNCEFTLKKSTHIPHYLYVEAYRGERLLEKSGLFRTPVFYRKEEQMEKLNRGLIAVSAGEGIFLGWRMLLSEVSGYNKTGMTGTDYVVLRNGKRIALVTDSTNYLDKEGTAQDSYQVAACEMQKQGAHENEAAVGGAAATEVEVKGGTVNRMAAMLDAVVLKEEPCAPVSVWKSGSNFLEIPLQIPEGGVTPAGQEYTYSANDMSVGDVDGDGEYEYFVKWDPSNSHDVSHKGYTGNCYIDCYKLDGRLLWRLDMGVNIRAGAHYTQFMVYDFDGDGKAEMSVKTAPGTKMTVYDEAGGVVSEKYITMPESDLAAGYSNEDNYVCSAQDYYESLVSLFKGWQDHQEVASGRWPSTLEECFGIEKQYSYPLSDEDARKLVDYFMDVYAPSRSSKNELRNFEGFILKGPEYLTMWAGDGRELETIPFPVPRVDDGLMWGDYEWNRIEPGNRVDRFLSGVAYLDGERPYLIICRGYYTRATITAYDFFTGKHREYFKIDSGFIPMANPFNQGDGHRVKRGTDPVYGCIVGQGDHSLSVADVDGDGCQEIIYGAATIDHDGSVLYSTAAPMPDGRMVSLGHGDSMHVARIDPDRPGFEIFNVFEEGKSVPYGYALRDGETGEVIFGEPGDRDLGRCMIGKVSPDVRGLQVWVLKMQDCKGNVLPDKMLGTNASIRWASDLSTQVTDGVDYVHGKHIGLVGDNTHGIMLIPEDTSTNNGTKGNPCLVADLFGDFREELLLRTSDSRAIRIYTNTDLTAHKLFTLMHDTMYRVGIAWQNNCYNQPCYTSFYYANDMDFKDVLPYLVEE